MEVTELNLYQRMAKITAELKTVGKNLTVTVTKQTGYKAVGERDVIDAVKPLEEKYGVFSYPAEREIIMSEVLTRTFRDGNKREEFFVRVKTVYRFVNVDKPEEYIEITSFGDGIDSGDKAPGKAMTYADKYALLKGYKISTGDDPDAEGSPEEGYNHATVKCVCSRCKKPITGWTDSNGQTFSGQQWATITKRDFGCEYCGSCANAVFAERQKAKS